MFLPGLPGSRYLECMAIMFGCMCGKRLSATETFAGRQLKCPRCSRLLTIPGSLVDDFIRFRCSCGKKLKAHRRDAGEEIDCPACGRDQHIPQFAHTPLLEAPGSGRGSPQSDVLESTGSLLVVPLSPTPKPAPVSHNGRAASRRHQTTDLMRFDDGLSVLTLAPWRDEAARHSNPPAPAEPRVKPLPWLAFLLIALVIGGAVAYFLSH
jgi:hypothetical protein